MKGGLKVVRVVESLTSIVYVYQNNELVYEKDVIAVFPLGNGKYLYVDLQEGEYGVIGDLHEIATYLAREHGLYGRLVFDFVFAKVAVTVTG